MVVIVKYSEYKQKYGVYHKKRSGRYNYVINLIDGRIYNTQVYKFDNKQTYQNYNKQFTYKLYKSLLSKFNINKFKWSSKEEHLVFCKCVAFNKKEILKDCLFDYGNYNKKWPSTSYKNLYNRKKNIINSNYNNKINNARSHESVKNNYYYLLKNYSTKNITCTKFCDICESDYTCKCNYFNLPIIKNKIKIHRGHNDLTDVRTDYSVFIEPKRDPVKRGYLRDLLRLRLFNLNKLNFFYSDCEEGAIEMQSLIDREAKVAQFEMMNSIKNLISSPVKEVINSGVDDKVNQIKDTVKNLVESAQEHLENSSIQTTPVQQSTINLLITNLAHIINSRNITSFAISIVSIFIQFGIFTYCKYNQLLDLIKAVYCKYFGDNESDNTSPPVVASTSKANIASFEMDNHELSTLIAAIWNGSCGIMNIASSTPKDINDLTRILLMNTTNGVRNNNGMVLMLKNLFEVVTNIFNRIVVTSNISGYMDQLRTTTPEIVSNWAEEINYLTDPQLATKISISKELQDRIYFAHYIGELFFEEQLSNVTKPNIRPLEHFFNKISTLKDEIFMMGLHPNVRRVPYCIWVQGKAGIGKSHLYNKISSDMLESVNYRGSCEKTCTLIPTSKYWSMCNGQPVAYVDDMFAVKTPESLEAQINIMFMIMSCAVLNPPKASVTEKKERYAPEILYINSNVFGCVGVNEITTPEAFHRRRNMVIKAELNLEAVAPYGVANAHDLHKCPSDFLDECKHLNFYVHSSVYNETGVSDRLDYAGLIKKVQESFVAHRAHQMASYTMRCREEYRFMHTDALFKNTNCIRDGFDILKNLEAQLAMREAMTLEQQLEFMTEGNQTLLQKIKDMNWIRPSFSKIPWLNKTNVAGHQMDMPMGQNTESTIDSSNVQLGTIGNADTTAACQTTNINWRDYCTTEVQSDFDNLTNREFYWKTINWKADSKLIKLPFLREVLMSLDTDILDNTTTAPFGIHTYWSGDITIRAQINSTKMQVGQMQMAWLYQGSLLPDLDNRLNSYGISQMPHSLLNAGASNEAVINIPFKYIRDYLHIKKINEFASNDYGLLIFNPLAPLQVATGNSPSADISLFVRFDNCKFTGMMNSKIAKFEMDLVSAVETGLTLVNRVRNMDKPLDPTPPTFVVPTASHSWSIGNGIPGPRHPLRLTGTSQTPNDSKSIDTSDMLYKQLAMTPSLLQQLKWSTSDANGKLLWITKVAPLLPKENYFITKNATNKTLARVAVPLLGCYASKYCKFHGTIDYRFDIVASQFHTGRLYVGVVPGNITQVKNGDVTSDIPLSSIRSSTSAVFSLQDNMSFTFRAPYISDRYFYPNLVSDNPEEIIDPPCTLYVYVLNSLNSIANIRDNILINIYVSGGPDFEMAIPCQPKLTTDAGILLKPNENVIPHRDTDKSWYLGTWHSFKESAYLITRWGTLSDQIAQFDVVNGKQYFCTNENIWSFKKANGSTVTWYNNFYLYHHPSGYGVAVPLNGTINLDLVARVKKYSSSYDTVIELLRSLGMLFSSITYAASDYQPEPLMVISHNLADIPLTDFIVVQHEMDTMLLNPSDNTTSNVSRQVFGEQFQDDKNLYRRMQFVKQIKLRVPKNKPSGKVAFVESITSYGTDVDPQLTSDLEDIIRQGPITFDSSCYRHFRGSIVRRYVIQNFPEANAWCQHRPDIHENLNQIRVATEDETLSNFRQHAHGIYIQSLRVNPVFEVEIPYYNENHFVFNHNIKDSKMVKQYKSAVDLGTVFFGFDFTNAVNIPDEIIVQIYMSFGDDASFSTFIGFPSVCYVNDVKRRIAIKNNDVNVVKHEMDTEVSFENLNYIFNGHKQENHTYWCDGVQYNVEFTHRNHAIVPREPPPYDPRLVDGSYPKFLNLLKDMKLDWISHQTYGMLHYHENLLHFLENFDIRMLPDSGRMLPNLSCYYYWWYEILDISPQFNCIHMNLRKMRNRYNPDTRNFIARNFVTGEEIAINLTPCDHDGCPIRVLGDVAKNAIVEDFVINQSYFDIIRKSKKYELLPFDYIVMHGIIPKKEEIEMQLSLQESTKKLALTAFSWLKGTAKKIWKFMKSHLFAILTTAILSLTIIGIGQDIIYHKREHEQIFSNAVHQNNYLRNRTQHVASKIAVKTVQHNMGQATMEIMNTLQNNVVILVGKYVDSHGNNRVLHGRSLGIRGRDILILKHYLEVMKSMPGIEFYIQYKQTRGGSMYSSEISLNIDECPIKWFVNEDGKEIGNYGLMTLPANNSRLFRDITGLFVNQSDYDRIGADCLLLQGETGWMQQVSMSHTFNWLLSSPDTACTDVKLDVGFEYEKAALGMCGTVLYSMSLNKIVGIHVGGNGNNRGVAEPICKECFSTDKRYLDPEQLDLSKDDDFIIDIEGAFDRIGTVPRREAHMESGLSIIVPSHISGVFPVRTEPAPLKKNDSRLIQPAEHPKKVGVEKHCKIIKQFPKESFDIAVADYKDLIFSKVKPLRSIVSRLSYADVVDGIPSLKGYEPMNLSTSEGYPLKKYRPKGVHGKNYLFKRVPVPEGLKTIGIHKNLLDQITKNYELRMKNVVPATVFTDCLKDARIKKEKCCIPGKTRIFSVSPVDFTLEFNSLFGDFKAAFQEARLSAEHAIGINSMSKEWTDLARHITSKGQKIGDGDYSNFGPTLESNVAREMLNMQVEWSRIHGMPDRDCHYMEVMVEELVDSLHLCGNLVYGTYCGLPSGSPTTTPTNSSCNSVYIRIMYLEIMKRVKPEWANMLMFSKHVVLVSYGDDVLINFSDEIVEYFNIQTLHEEFQKYNISFTNADKGGNIIPYSSLSEVQFLKSKFIPFSMDRRQLLPGLDKVSIEDCCNWISKKGDALENTKNNCEMSLRLAFGWGPEYYEEVHTAIKEAFRAHKMAFKFYTYYDMANMYLREGAQDMTVKPIFSSVLV